MPLHLNNIMKLSIGTWNAYLAPTMYGRVKRRKKIINFINANMKDLDCDSIKYSHLYTR